MSDSRKSSIRPTDVGSNPGLRERGKKFVATSLPVANESEDRSYLLSHGGTAQPKQSPIVEMKPHPNLKAGRTTAALVEHKPSFCRRIVVAVDKSEQSGWALEVAVRMAQASETELAMVHVIDDAPFVCHPSPVPVLDGEQSAAEIFWERTACVPAQLRLQQFLRKGVAGREIVNAASEWDADLIVMGTHGRGTVSRFFLFLGSVADHVLRYAKCPVLTVSHSPAAAHMEEAQAVEDALAGMPM